MLEQKQERAAALPREAEKKAIKALQKELAALQQPLRAAGVPVLLVFEGWSAAGKGSMIAKVISEMDPRGYQVYSAAEPTDEEARRPLLWPFWRDLPPRGEAAVLDRSWYGRVLEQMEAEHGRAGALLESVNIFERLTQRCLARSSLFILVAKFAFRYAVISRVRASSPDSAVSS